MAITIPDIVPYLLASLGLLFLWQLHSLQVRAGRIKAVDIWNRSGIRLFLHVTPEDSHACAACREVNNTAFLPEVVASMKFGPLTKPCTNPSGCRCLMVGLHGSWPEALRLQGQLMRQAGRVCLSSKEMTQLLDGALASTTTSDQISIAVLEAIRAESSNPDVAIKRYLFVIDHVQADRDLAFVVPASLRLSELLEQFGRKDEALAVADQFLKVYGDREKHPHGPTEEQRSLMSLRVTRLLTSLQRDPPQ